MKQKEEGLLGPLDLDFDQSTDRELQLIGAGRKTDHKLAVTLVVFNVRDRFVDIIDMCSYSPVAEIRPLDNGNLRHVNITPFIKEIVNFANNQKEEGLSRRRPLYLVSYSYLLVQYAI